MSLQVWLPLNGDLNNQGLLGPLTQTASPSFTDNGKIGKALSGGSCIMTAEQSAQVLNNKEVSISCWIYPNAATGTSGGILFGTEGMGTNNNRKFSIFLYPTVNDLHLSWQNDAATTTFIGSVDNGLFPSYTWTHLTVVYKNPEIKIYINGVLRITRSGVSNSSSFAYDTPIIHNNSSRYVNDFRIYNHALSVKEVKEISKGLVLHFPMMGNGGQDNIFINSYFNNNYIGSEVTNQHTNLMANNWGGYNGGVGNPTTVYHAHLVEKEGQYVYKYVRNANNPWIGISQDIKTKTTPGVTYTFSCELYRISGTNYPNGGHYTKASSTASNSFLTWYDFSDFKNAPVGQWITYSSTKTLPSTAYINDGVRFYIYGHDGGSGEFLMRHPKLEVGDNATEWMPSPSDTIYESLGFNSNIEIDRSGYGYNGTKVNTAISSDSPRNNTSIFMNGTAVDTTSNTLTGASYLTAKISLPASSAMTVSWWGKIVKYGRGGIFETTAYEYDPINGTDYNTTAFANWDSTFGVYNGTTRVNLYSDLVKVDSQWYLHTITYDGSNVKYYRNGTLISTNALAGTLPAITAIRIGIGKAGGVYRQIQQYVSDFRMYVTALSAEDVKELYQIPISIDKNGDMFSLSYSENGTKHSFYKSGIVEGALWEKDEPFSLMKNNIPFRENLFKNSNSFGLINSDYSTVSTRTVGKIVISSDSTGNAHNWMQSCVEGGMTSIFQSTKTMTLSMDIKIENVTNANASGTVSMDYRKSDHSNLIISRRDLILDGKWHRYYMPLTANNNGQSMALVCMNFQNLNGATIYYKNIKYEEGATGSPWCPSKSEGFTNNMTTMVAPISANQFYEV